MKKYFKASGGYKFIYIGLLKVIDSVLSIISLSLIYPLTLFVLQNQIFFEKIQNYFPFLIEYDYNIQILFVFSIFFIFTCFRYVFGVFSIKKTSNFLVERRFFWVEMLVEYFHNMELVKLKKEKTGKLVSDWFNDTFNASQFLNVLISSVNQLSFLFFFFLIVVYDNLLVGFLITVIVICTLTIYFLLGKKSQINRSTLKLKFIQGIMILMNDIISYLRDIKIYSLKNNAKIILNNRVFKLSKILIDNLNSSKKPALVQESIIAVLVTFSFLFFYFFNFNNLNINFSYIILIITLGFKSLGYISQLIKSFYKASIDFRSFVEISRKFDYVNNIIVKDENLTINNIDFEKLVTCDVDFTYDKTKIFQTLNLEIPLKNHILITGNSGSGKSTFSDLLVCLIKPSKGFIELIDDKGIKYNNNKSYYSYVSQEVGLFGDSIDSCICGNMNFNEKKLKTIVKLCELDAVYESQKINFNISSLSGGQKTRIGLARALYYERPILILDESLSSLEENLEYNIIKNIRKIFKGITILQVLHERSQKTLADYRISIKNAKATIKKI